jgi:DnaJ-class molecular chaperone
MFKVRVLSKCQRCNGEAYLPIEECEDSQGKTYIRYSPCPTCEGSGNQAQWVNLEDLAKLIFQAGCSHQNTSFQGNRHFSAGDVWDDIHEVCNDCGASLDNH